MTTTTDEPGTALALPAPEALPALFRDPDEIDRLISRIEAEARAHVADVATTKGRREIASLAHKVARSKTALDEAGKQLNAGLRRQIDVVDQERRKVREFGLASVDGEALSAKGAHAIAEALADGKIPHCKVTF
jgi:colicin import membrane protein